NSISPECPPGHFKRTKQSAKASIYAPVTNKNGANEPIRIGVPKEIKVHEYRVGLTPASVAELVAHGHELFVETHAGKGIDCPDSAYEKAGAKILPDAKSVFD